MSDNYQVEYQADKVVIILPEKVFIPNSRSFYKTLQNLFEQGHKNVQLDCRHLKMFDTAGVSGVAIFQKKLKDAGGKLKIVNVKNDYIIHLFETIELNKIVDIEEVSES